MKKLVFILCLVLLSSLSLFAQISDGEKEKLKKKDPIQKQIIPDNLSLRNKETLKSKEKIENQIDVWNSFNEKEKLRKLELLISELNAKKEMEENHQNIMLIESLIKSTTDLKNKISNYNTISKFFQDYNNYENLWQKPDRNTPKRMQGTKTEKDSQRDTEYITPHNSSWWTGSVYKDIVGNYVDENLVVKAGDNWIYTKWRSYARFDITGIPDNANVTSIELKAYTCEVSSSSGHMIKVKKLTVDPLSTGGSALYNDIGNDVIGLSWWTDAMCTYGYHTIPLYTEAEEDLEAHLSAGYSWWAVGFQESGDDDAWGQFDGYDWEEPYCIVTYTIPFLTISPTSHSSPYQGDSFTITVSSNISWGVSSNVGWITWSGASGSGNDTFTVTVSANPSTSSRSGTVTVSGGGITRTCTITQGGAPEYLTISPTSHNSPYQGDSFTISVSSNISWGVSSNVGWITWSGASGSGNDTFTVTVSANPSTSSRSGTVTVSGGGITRTCTVTQDPGPTEINDLTIPINTELTGNHPNPFNPETTIKFSLKGSGYVILEIYDIKGKKVKTLVNEVLPAGEHSAIWNGRDSNDKRVSSGIYFYRMQTDNYQKIRKMILIK